jgi:hypothetical protein
MPFIYDETQREWPDDGDFEPPPPRPDQFVYIPPSDFGGAPEPVRFSVEPVAIPVESSQPQQTAERQPPAPARPQRRSILDVLLGRRHHPSSSPQRPQISYEEIRRQREREHERHRQQFFAVIIPELRKIGARRACCRYDGGNDEGFSWLDSIEIQNGGRINAVGLARRLLDVQLLDKLDLALGLNDSRSDQQRLDDVVSELCGEWACMLLGEGYGTGEYSMYGAFTVDLETCTITDDRNADPIVENIRIAT